MQAWRNSQRRKIAAEFRMMVFAYAVKVRLMIQSSVQRATGARISEASARIVEHLAATDQSPLPDYRAPRGDLLAPLALSYSTALARGSALPARCAQRL
ncbi:hypothetical protein JG688_00015978 [Phytophthora aleatoria]|uniref:Uncharacterized protein n=1 Tax=Phytophthora aleatoria TaxID=2496075 RepID=A0A8J5I961_9STRA|nr:hypothetical protein JG688_00015978 [Phytophthora aleatoria]